jgi:AcrR family transcriptional regulator
MADKTVDSVFARTFPVGHRKGDQKRFEIINTAIRLLAKQGIAALAFDQIANEIGTRRSHIRYYFHSREDLLNDILKYITATAQEITIEEVQKAASAKARLLAIADGAFIWSDRHPEQLKVMLLFYFIFSHDEAFCKMHTEIRTAGWMRLQSVLESVWTDNSKMKKRIPEVAKNLQAVITGLLVEKATIQNAKRFDYPKVFRDLYEELLNEEKNHRPPKA